MTTGSATAPRPVSFSTEGLPEAQKIALWEDHNAHALIGLRCHMLGEATLDATELNLQLEQVHLARVRGSAHVVERPPEVIRSHPADAIAVYLTLVGEALYLANARAFIEDHLTDAGLSAARVAAGIGISERHLSRAFATTGSSVPQFVLARRLERTRAVLQSAPQTPVGEVAAR